MIFLSKNKWLCKNISWYMNLKRIQDSSQKQKDKNSGCYTKLSGKVQKTQVLDKNTHH